MDFWFRDKQLPPPRLSLLLVRWGGSTRIGEYDDVEAEGDGGWGQYGCPPCDWYIEGLLNTGAVGHPIFANPPRCDPTRLNFEALSIFLGPLYCRCSPHCQAVWPATHASYNTFVFICAV